MKIGIAGTGGIGLASAAWLAHHGHAVTLWSPGGEGTSGLRHAPLVSQGVLTAEVSVSVASDAAALCEDAQLLIVAVPVNGHRTVMDALLPQLKSGAVVLVSSMSSLSSLVLHEAARARGLDIAVASLGTTVLTARRDGPSGVRVMTRRSALGLSALPHSRTGDLIALATALFGQEGRTTFSAHENALATALTNINPVAHGPLALFNWTRIERAEAWPQYHHMTPQVAAVIERLDAERLALAAAFGVEVRTIGRHFAQSFGTKSERLADIAAELHAARGGPPGPTDTGTRFITEDVPYGLVFSLALGRIAGVPMPATAAVVGMADLVTGREPGRGWERENDLLGPLGLASESVQGLRARVMR